MLTPSTILRHFVGATMVAALLSVSSAAWGGEPGPAPAGAEP